MNTVRAGGAGQVADATAVLDGFTIIQGLNLYAGGVGNFGQNPMFLNDADLRLRASSPAINAGDPGTVVGDGETDLDGNPRIQGGRIDMGAYEFNTP